MIESPDPPAVNVEDGKTEVRMTAGQVVVVVKKSPLLVTFANTAGTVLLADEPALPMAWDGTAIHVWKRMPSDENYFGLGDKPGPMNRRNHAYTMWNTDFFGWQESDDPLYKTIPFFIGLRKGTAYALFFDNTYRSSFDFGKESRDYFSFGADSGELNYFCCRPRTQEKLSSSSPRLSAARLFRRSGRLATNKPLQLLSKRAPRSSKRYAKKIPADAIYFDIDYQQGNAPFTVNADFPHFEKMISDFRAQGIRTILITDAHQERSSPRLRSVRFRDQAGCLRQES